MKIFTVIFLFLSCFTVYAQDGVITVSIEPQKYVVDKISGGSISVNVLVPASADPHTFSPKPQDALLLAKSSLYLGIGFPFEASTLPQIASAYKNLPICDTSLGIEKEEEHGHEHGGEHMDPHVWVSPANMRIIAMNTAHSLTEAYPENAESYKAGLAKFLKEIDAIDIRFEALFAGKEDFAFISYHPSFGYFAKAYGLHQLSVEADGKSPKAADLADLIQEIKEENISIFIIHPQGAGGAGGSVAKSLGIAASEMNILQYDWMAMMDRLYTVFSDNM